MKDKVSLVLILAVCTIETKAQVPNATPSTELHLAASGTDSSPTFANSASPNSDESDPIASIETASSSTDSDQNPTDRPASTTPTAPMSTFSSLIMTNLSTTNDAASTPIGSIETVPPPIAHSSTIVPTANSPSPSSNVVTPMANSSTLSFNNGASTVNSSISSSSAETFIPNSSKPSQTISSSTTPISTLPNSKAPTFTSLNATILTLPSSLTPVPATTTSGSFTPNSSTTPHGTSLGTTTTTAAATTTTTTLTTMRTTTTYLMSTPKQASVVDNVIYLICQLCFQMRKPCPCFGHEEGVRIQPTIIQRGSPPFLQDSFDLARISRCRDVPSEVGGCSNFQVAWSYVGGNKCVQFVYSGCGSSSNVFQSKRLCLRTCGLESSMF